MNQHLVEDAKRGGYISEIMRRLGSLEVDIRNLLSKLGIGREVLKANRTYYVRTDGSDSNDGLANTAARAFLTIQKAINVALTLDLRGNAITISVANGTYTGTVLLSIPFVGGNVAIVGDTTTPSNVHINTVGDCVTVSGPVALSVAGLKFSSSAGSGLRAQYLATLAMTGVCEFGTCANFHLYSTDGGFISLQANYNISGGAAVHYYAPGGEITTPGNTVTLSGTPAFSAAFAYVPFMGLLAALGQTFAGTGATGTRYFSGLNSVIFTNGGGPNYFPGNAAGSTDGFGVYA